MRRRLRERATVCSRSSWCGEPDALSGPHDDDAGGCGRSGGRHAFPDGQRYHAYAYYGSGTLWAPIAVHAANNWLVITVNFAANSLAP